MIGAWSFVAIGSLLMVLVVFLLRRPKISANNLDESRRGRGSFSAVLHEEAFRHELAARIFGPEDWNFIVKQGSPQLKHLFLQRRKTLALSWLRNARVHATELIHAHRTVVRSSSGLEPLVELRITVDYHLFEMLCQLIAFAIWLRGPVDLSRLIGYVDALSLRLAEANRGLLPAQLARENGKR